ncbi:MAG: septum formation initiator family protein [Bacteroidetes bacterium SB0662_bin_6]|nr:septum formation initiator family protein [Bacteroidetes bacterium SB0668_bin_1]MYE05449.1 septum formation initiator family protein [Bacteroidetes bacterium SB0662_bin_6]
MPSSRLSLSTDTKRRLGKIILWAIVAAALGSFVFLDSHSLLKRMTWRNEYTEVRQENERLRADIEQLEKEVSEGLSDEAVEKIAREEYGMHRPGETVYPVEERTHAKTDAPESRQHETMNESPDHASERQRTAND